MRSDVERESSLGICGDLVFDIEKLAFYVTRRSSTESKKLAYDLPSNNVVGLI